MQTVLTLLVLAATSHAEPAPVEMGDLTPISHDVKGKIFSSGEKNLIIENANFDGEAPDGMFWVGTQGTPRDNVLANTAVLAHPFNDKHYKYQDKSNPKLGKLSNEKVMLTLPPHLKTSDITWVSVWCRNFKVNFGSWQKKGSEVRNAEFMTRGDISVQSAAGVPWPQSQLEPSPEPEPEGNGAPGIASILVCLAIAMLPLFLMH